MKTGNQIKKELQEAGIPTKKISVRNSSCSIQVSIKDLSIESEKVEAVVKKHESIDRCERTFEVLQGGNTFVIVSYDWDALKEKWSNTEFAASILKDFKENFGTGYVHMYHVKKSLTEWVKNNGGLARSALESVVGSVLWGHREELEAVGIQLKH